MKKLSLSYFTFSLRLAVLTGCLTSPLFAMTGNNLAVASRYAAVVRINQCSAVFIHPRLLVTAAHCIDKNNDHEIHIRKNSRNGHYFSARVVRAIAHQDYSERFLDRDIGFILLEEDITDKEILANIPTLASSPTEQSVIVEVGVGQKNERSSSFGFEGLRSEEFKKKVYSRLESKKGSLLTMRPVTRGETHCSGDSGGGLFTESSNGALRLIGVITAHNDTPCGASNFISYGEEVSVWKTWLEENSGLNLTNTLK